MEVPVPDLLQVSHPGYRLVVARPHLNDKDIMSIVDYAQRMAERFEHYGQIVVTAPFLFEMLKQSFDTLLNDDDPSVVIPVRELTARLLEEHEHMTNNMVRAFPVNPVVKGVYTDLSEVLYDAFDLLTGGDMDD
jgi:hypothetical protein